MRPVLYVLLLALALPLSTPALSRENSNPAKDLHSLFDFDIRAFHDVVLGSGAVPLDVLEANERRWMAAHP